MSQQPIFYQLYEHESSTYTYLIADPVTGEAALIDPVIETVERDIALIQDLGVKLKYILDTHVHADHITGAGEIRRRTGAQTALSEGARVACVDMSLKDGQTLKLGQLEIRCLSTPGHTDSCMSYVCAGRVFTGDALLIRGTGRTDFQQGSPEKMYNSIHEKLYTLPEDTQVYPGHDYRGQTSSTIGLEKKFNPRIALGRSKAEFVKIMSELKLANPKKIHEAVPANMACGQVFKGRVLGVTMNDGVPEVQVVGVSQVIGKVKIIDVRRPDEFNNELGHIEGAKLVTLGAELTEFLNQGDRSEEIVFVCRSGGRSGQATAESIKLGYKFTSNMVGGMIRWNESSLPVKRA